MFMKKRETMDEENFILVKISEDGYVLELKNVPDKYRYQSLK